jgi:hypothetical protein
MTIQSEADTAASEHAQLSRWQRLAPFLDVIGAVLISGSWIFSPSGVGRALYQTAMHVRKKGLAVEIVVSPRTLVA